MQEKPLILVVDNDEAIRDVVSLMRAVASCSALIRHYAGAPPEGG
jgi:CheY-like chemotaxis protein